MKRPWSKRSKTLFYKLLRQFILAVILQTILFAAVFLFSGILPHMEQNAYSLLSQRTKSRADALINSMTQRWSRLDSTKNRIVSEVERHLSQKNASWSDVHINAALNEQLVTALAPDLISMIRTNGVTGAFLVLDGAGVPNHTAQEVRAGLYIRDLDPNSDAAYTFSGSDLLMERGLSSISKVLNIPLDSYWSAGFRFSKEGNLPNEQFYFRPFRAALESNAPDDAAYGYWSPLFSLSGSDGHVITYSMPLIASDGAVFGVLGVDLTETHLISLMRYSDLWDDKMGSYCLAITEDGGQSYHPVLVSGISYRRFFDEGSTLHNGGSISSQVIRLDNGNGKRPMLASIENLHLYNANTPFSSQQWVLMGMVEEGALLSFSSQVTSMICWALLLALLLGLLGSAISSRLITKPIILLASELKSSNPEKAVRLQKLNIAEIDQLTDSIEELSSAVAESASKIQKIIAMTGARIGVFEHAKDTRSVFLSKSLFELMGWPPCDGDFGYLDVQTFHQRMEQLENVRDPNEKDIYRITQNQSEWWIQIHTVHEDEQVLGTVMDVTREIQEKQKLAYERDYDVLTSLFNRRGFIEHGGRLLLDPREAKVCALVMWDMDNLKYINDTYGHKTGDEYIQAFAQCLHYGKHLNVMAARRSGDEFYALVYGYENRDSAMDVVLDICRRIAKTTILLPSGIPYRLRASCGVAWYPYDATILEDLVRYADFAMYQAKHTRKGELQEFNRLLYDGNEVLLSGQEALNNLIEQALIDYAMQPILCVKTGHIFGYEMLMRPRGSDFTGPRDVLRLARSHAQLCRVERLTWFGAMQTFVNCLQIGSIPPESRVFIHSIPSCSMNTTDLSSFEMQFKPYLRQVVLEIAQGDPSSEGFLRDKMLLTDRWEAMVAIDDFGSNDTGDTMLATLSPHLVKIGMSVTRNIDTDKERQQMLCGIIGICRERNVQVIAEGVETREEMEVLIHCGVDYLQGYYISLPSMPPLMPSREIIGQMTDALQKVPF